MLTNKYVHQCYLLLHCVDKKKLETVIKQFQNCLSILCATYILYIYM